MSATEPSDGIVLDAELRTARSLAGQRSMARAAGGGPSLNPAGVGA